MTTGIAFALILCASLAALAATALWTDWPAPVCNLAGFVVMVGGALLFL